jgi:hypothetical protein
MAAGDVAVCTGKSDFPLFRRPNITDMVETLRQLHEEADRMQFQSDVMTLPPARDYGPDS